MADNTWDSTGTGDVREPHLPEDHLDYWIQTLIMEGEHLPVLQVETKAQGRVEVRTQDCSSPDHELQQRG